MAAKRMAKDPQIVLLCRDVSGLPTHLFHRSSVYVPTDSGWTFAKILEGSVGLVPLADSDHRDAQKVKHWEQKKAFFDAVVAIGTGLEESVVINDACRSVPVPFFWLREVGQILSLFVDPGKDELVINPRGRCRLDDRPLFIYGVYNSGGAWLVYTQIPHQLESGDIVTIQGCEEIPDELQNANLLVENLSRYRFLVNKLDARMDVVDYSGSCSDGQIRLLSRENEPQHTFRPLRSNLTRPQLDHFGGRCCKSLHVALLKKLENNSEDFVNYKSKFTFDCCEEELTQIGDLDARLVENISGLGLGVALVLHQIDNLRSGRFRPIKQWGYITTENLRPSSIGSSVSNPLDFTGKSIVLTEFGPLTLMVLQDLAKLWSKLRFKKIVLLMCAKDSLMETAFNRTLGVSTSFEYVEGALSEFFLRYPEIELEFIEQDPLSDTIISLSNTDFWNTVGMVITTKASYETRCKLGNLSLDYKFPLIEVGVDGQKAHLQTILPGVTEIRNPEEDSLSSDSPPYCVIKSFPRNSDDCVEWAQIKADNLLINKPANYNEALQEQSMSELVAIGSAEASNLSAGQLSALKVLRDRCETWTECVAFARRKFEKYFKLKALTLLHHFPPDTKAEDGKFWDPPKNIPTKGIEFTPSNPLHLEFIKTLAHCWASIWGVQVTDFDLSDEQLVIVLSAIKMDPQHLVVKSKKIVTDESVRGENVEEGQETSGLDVDSLKELALRVNTKGLEIKISSKLYKNLIDALANLRAATYRIPMDHDSIDAVAAKSPSCSLEAATVLSQLINIEILRISVFGRYPANWWVSLLEDPWILRTDSVACSFCKLGDLTYSSWDTLDVFGNENWTLNDFLTDLEKRFGQTVELVTQGSKMIFVEFMPSHQKRRTKLMKDQIIIKPGEQKVVLAITVGDDTITCPPINYYPN